MSFDLPAELTDQIIGHIPRYDISTLNACAASGRQTITASRAAAFTFLRIGHSQIHSLHQLLASDSFGCTFKRQVRTLAIGHPMQPLPQTQDASILSYLLESFPNLNDMTMISWFGETFSLAGPDFKLPVIPTLTALRLHGLQFDDEATLLKVVCAYPSLQTLEISGISFKRPDLSIPPLRLPPTLTNVTIDAEERECQNVIVWLASYCRLASTRGSSREPEPPKLPPITILRIKNVSNKVAVSIYDILTALKESLKDLSIYSKHGAEDAESLIQSHPLLASLVKVRLLTYGTTSTARNENLAVHL